MDYILGLTLTLGISCTEDKEDQTEVYPQVCPFLYTTQTGLTKPAYAIYSNITNTTFGLSNPKLGHRCLSQHMSEVTLLVTNPVT